jgi:hypothetical protein
MGGRELFDECALLAAMDDDRNDVAALLDAALFEINKRLERLRVDISTWDFLEIIADAASMNGLAFTVESQTLALACERLARMAVVRDKDEISNSFKDIESCLREFETHLWRSGWRRPGAGFAARPQVLSAMRSL